MKPFSTYRARPRMVVSVDGMPFTGKTHFALSAPQPLEVFNIDRGLEGVIEDMQEHGFSFDRAEFEDYSLDRPPLTSKLAFEHARTTVKKFHRTFRELLQTRSERLSIVVDTSSEFWQHYRLADLGALEKVPPMRYVRVNRLYRDLMNEVYNTPHNLVLIHRLKDRYDTKVIKDSHGEEKEVSVRVPGETERDGFKEMDGIVQVTIETFRRDKKSSGRPIFGFRVMKCRARSSLMGQVYEGEFATFGHLACDVFPKTDPADWGIQ